MTFENDTSMLAPKATTEEAADRKGKFRKKNKEFERLQRIVDALQPNAVTQILLNSLGHMHRFLAALHEDQSKLPESLRVRTSDVIHEINFFESQFRRWRSSTSLNKE